MNETIKKFFITNMVALVTAIVLSVLWISSIILGIRADANAAISQGSANAQTIQQQQQTLNTLVPEVAQIKQFSQDTNDKVSFIYSRIK